MKLNKANIQQSRKSASGFTMVEMLVAMVVLSVGLLGLASLQANSLRMNDSAYYRTQATYLGYDILERMRANSIQAITEEYDLQAADSPGSTSIAAADLAEWDGLITSLLPGGQRSIDCDTAGLCTITISWDDSRAATATEAARKVITLNTQI